MSRIVIHRTLTILVLTAILYVNVASSTTQSQILSSIQSIFQDGDIYRIPLSQSGVYKIDVAWLNEHASSSNLVSDQIQVYGIKGGPLRHNTTYEETERLEPIPMSIVDGGDNRINGSDYILFYAEDADHLYFDDNDGVYKVEKNPFSEVNFVFLKIGGTINQCLITTEVDTGPPSFLTSKYLYQYTAHEDKVNLLHDFESTQGSGQVWYGDELSNVVRYNLSDQLKWPTDGLEEVTIRGELAGRSDSREEIVLSIAEEAADFQFSPVNTSDIEALYARKVVIRASTTALAPTDDLHINFNKTSARARLWLDYISVQGMAEANYNGEATLLNNHMALQAEYSFDGLSITNGSALRIWDITNIHDVIQKNIYSRGGAKVIHIGTDKREAYYAFAEGDIITPGAATKFEGKDLLNLGDNDMIIISTPITEDAAKRLHDHRLRTQELKSTIITPQEIFDHYSSGRQDPTAIRNFVREVYRRDANFRFLLLLGDASYDYRYLNKTQSSNHLVPTFETFNSLDPLFSFPSDDYFALLDDDEDGRLVGDLDISVGRLTVTTGAEADAVINKIISYDQQRSGAGSWKTQVVFLADDEDNNLHINDADRIANELAINFPLVNQEKIYFDAFRQESTPGGNRYPTATDRLNRTVEKGSLVINYLGHGGRNGWAQERVLKIDDINSWSNFDRLPLIITATCSFTGFDNPAITSAGEASLLHPTGGALSLFTTVRSVFASKNFRLTRAVFDELFQKEDGRYLSIGEIMRRAKNKNPNDSSNGRKFFLIGDPTIHLAIPNLEIQTDKINGRELTADSTTEQLSALDQVYLEASIRTTDGDIQTNYNGTVDIIVYDKPTDVQTFGNDARSFVKTFKRQQNTIYKGVAEVINGKFNTSFTIPVDIDYNVGAAKISYFASGSAIAEAAGYNNQLLIGGQSKDPVADDQGPVIKAYLNNRLFVSGDEVPVSNKMIIDLSDDFGINLSSTGIGHEITAVLDDDSQSVIFLNEFLEGSSSDARSGTINYILPDLEPGPHQLTIKAFDVANNPGEVTIEFIVSEDIKRTINRIINAPNPINGSTVFDIYQDLLDGDVRVTMDVFDLSGRRIDTYSTSAISVGGKVSFTWAPKINEPGYYVCYFTLKSSSSGETDLSSGKKVFVLK